jgi:hypothetical protein
VAKRHGNKEGTIYKRKDGRWCAQVSVNGRRLTKYGSTQGEVREWLKETINQLDQGIAAAAPQTLKEYLSAWLEAVKPSIRPKSYETYDWKRNGGMNLKKFIPPFFVHCLRYYRFIVRSLQNVTWCLSAPAPIFAI